MSLTPGAVIPRDFTLHVDSDDWPLATPPPATVAAVIENGATGDVLKLGLATLVPAARPEDEALTLDAGQVARVAALVGRARLEGWGLI